jgi:GntR family transcriptional regulator
VLSGELNDGDPLPSIRQLARDLRVSVITTTGPTRNWSSRGTSRPCPARAVSSKTPDPAQVRDQVHGEVAGHLREAVAAARLAAMSADDLVGMLERILKEDGHG